MQSLADILTVINDDIIVEAHVSPTSSSDLVAAANAATLAAGHSPIGDAWRELTECPIGLLAHHIGHDLAYGRSRWFSPARCRELAEGLAAHADGEARWFTNNTELQARSDGALSSWSGMPVTDWTFDAAIVAVGSQNTLYICFMAED
jgi:hypothetical protein